MVLRHLSGYLQAKARAGDGAAASVLKLAMAQLVQESALVAVDVAGMHATAWLATDPEGGRWSAQLLSRNRPPSAVAPTRSCATSSPSGSSACPRDEEGDLMPGDLAPGPSRRAATGAR